MLLSRWLIYKIIVFYCFLSSARACMTLGDNAYVDMVLSVIALMILPGYYYEHTFKRSIAAFFLVVAAMYTMHGTWLLSAYAAQFFMVLIPAQLIFLKRRYQVELFNTLSKWYAVLLAASCVWWILWLLGAPLPHSTTGKLIWENGSYGYAIENYYLFRNTIDLNPYLSPIDIYRFNGFFLEPGHIGTITCVFLFANKYDFTRKINIIFLVIIIVSLSAAAYLLAVVGYCLYRYSRDGLRVVMPILAIIGAIVLAAQYNGGDNIINNMVFAKFTRENGAIDGRFSAETLNLWNQYLMSDQLIQGMGVVEIHQSAGFKVYLIMFGLLGASLVLMAYWSIVKVNDSRLGRFMFVLLVFSFIQRVYCFWDAFLDPYILGMAYLKAKDEKFIGT